MSKFVRKKFTKLNKPKFLKKPLQVAVKPKMITIESTDSENNNC